MRRWVCAALLAAFPSAAISQTIIATTRVTPELRASLTSDYTIEVAVTPHDGDAWTRLAKRLTGDAENWRAIVRYNDGRDALRSDVHVRVPLPLLRPQLQRQILTTLFPADALTEKGWKHVVVGSPGAEGESLWSIAEWFTGSGNNYAAIRKANPHQALFTHTGDVILIPKRLLTAAFDGEGEEPNASKTAEVRKPEDDPIEHAPADASSPDVAVESLTAGPPSLTYVSRAPEPYAVYRLQKGEALYSSVVIRFTGRVYADDVSDAVERVVKFNDIEDVAKIPAGYAVKIPMSLLSPEYLPPDDPSHVAADVARRESARAAKRTRASGLAGVHVILDAGHGGRDAGTTHDGMWESRYVYDVMCRLMKILKTRSAAAVTTTTRSKSLGYRISDHDVLGDCNDQAVLTSPPYDLDDPVVGVHLRWYLANSIFLHARNHHIPKQKVVFISIHADSLHPSLRGAMAYIPAERFVTGSYQKSDPIYLARAEVREHPVVRHSEEESLAAEGLSRDLAESIMDAFTADHLLVHPFDAVRDDVVRDGREWVPAIIRYNLVPTRMLIEVCNLGNRHDRELMRTRKYRQQLAQAMFEGLVNFYKDQDSSETVTTAAK